MMFDLPPKLFLPQKPAIIRASRLPESPTDLRGIGYHALGAGGAAMLAAGQTPVVRHKASYESTSTSSSITFTDVDVGVASADRLVVACFSWVRGDVSGSISGMTIAGNTATDVQTVQSSNLGGFSWVTSIRQYLLTTGTTATIVANLSHGGSFSVLDVFTIRVLDSTTKVHSDSDINASAASLTANVNVHDGGVLIAAGAYFANSSVTWTGAVKASDRVVSSQFLGSAALQGGLGTQTGRSVQMSGAGGAARISLAAASWR